MKPTPTYHYIVTPRAVYRVSEGSDEDGDFIRVERRSYLWWKMVKTFSQSNGDDLSKFKSPLRQIDAWYAVKFFEEGVGLKS